MAPQCLERQPDDGSRLDCDILAKLIEALAMAHSLDTFILSLDGAEPPPFATPMLRAVWHGLRGEWDAAHDLAQTQDDSEGAWVHAWLHRIEGDLANAGYWYQRAGRQARRDATRDEGLEIARALMQAMPAHQIP